MAEDTTIETRALKSLVSWYYTQFLIQPRGLDNNSLWLVTIYPQDANLLKFIDIIQTEAARFDVDVKAVDRNGIPGGYSGSTMGRMVDRAWLNNVLPLGDQATNLEGWGAANVLVPVVDVTLPPDNIATKSVDLGPGYTWVPPILADKHSKFNPLALTFYYTTCPFTEFIVRPWSMAINRWGLKLAKLRCNMVLTLFSRTNQWKNPKSRDWVHKYDYRFYGCYPLGVPNLRFDYKDSAQDKTVTVQFGYDFYRIDPEPGYPAYRAEEIINGKLDLSEVVADIKVNDGYNDEPTEASIDTFDSFRPVNNDDEPPKESADGGMATVRIDSNDEPYELKSKELQLVNEMSDMFNLEDISADEPKEPGIDIRLQQDDEPENIDSIRKRMLWLDTPILPLTLVFNPKRNDEPNRIASIDTKPGADEPRRIKSRVSEYLNSDEVYGVGDTSRTLDGGDEVGSVDDSIIVVLETDEPSSLGERLLAVDGDDEYRRSDMNILMPSDDEPSLPNNVIGRIADDEPEHFSPLTITIGEDEGLSTLKGTFKIEDDEAGHIRGADLQIPDGDEANWNRNNFKKPGSDEVDRISSNIVKAKSDEPGDVLPKSKLPKNDEVESVSLPVSIDPSDDEVKGAGLPRLIEATADEP